MNRDFKISREELYKRIWETPGSKLIEEFGITTFNLAQTCKKLKIPTPDRGHWAKIAAGQIIKIPPLAPLSEGVSNFAIFFPFEKPPKSLIRKSFRELAQSALREIEEKGFRVALPTELKTPHYLIKRLGNQPELENWEIRNSSKPRALLSVSKPFEIRASILIDVVFKTLGKLYFDPTLPNDDGRIDHSRANVDLGGIRLLIRIREAKEYVRIKTPHPLSSNGRYECSGRLSFDVGQLVIQETEKLKLEDQIPNILVRIITYVEKERLHHLKFEEEAKTKDLRAKQAEALKQQNVSEGNKQSALEMSASRWEAAQKMRAFIAACERDASVQLLSAEKVKAWFDWANQNADRLDPFKSDYLVEAILNREKT